MVLNNILADCELLSNLFKDLEQFTTLLEDYKVEINNTYYYILLELSKREETYQKSFSYMGIIYNFAQQITDCSFEIIETIIKFSYSHFYSKILDNKSNKFLNYTKEFIKMCNKSGSHKDDLDKRYTYAKNLHIKFEEVYECYIDLYSNISFFKSIMAELYNEVPKQIQSNSDYTELNIQSNKETSDLITMSKDIELVSNMIINIQALLPEDESKDYYIQKVESGSIFISIIAVTALIKIIIATVDYGATIYYKLKNNQINLKMKQTEVNKEEFRLSLLKKYQELGFNVENNGENLEQIEKIITTTIKYLDSNPSGKLNNEKYNIETQTTILTDKILQNTPVNEIAD